MRYAAKVDDVQQSIVKALRAVGVTVEPRLARIGGGVPDLLCGYRGRTFILEVKMPGAKLTEDETDWHNAWSGQVAVVHSPLEALEAIGYKDKGHFVEATFRSREETA